VCESKGVRELGSSGFVRVHQDLDVYQMAFGAAMDLFELTRLFPLEERYSLTDQMRKSSRSVCANIAEAWRKRRYKAAFVSKLSDAEAEAAETQTWIEFAVKCGYLKADVGEKLHNIYDLIIGKLVNMIHNPGQWLLKER